MKVGKAGERIKGLSNLLGRALRLEKSCVEAKIVRGGFTSESKGPKY